MTLKLNNNPHTGSPSPTLFYESTTGVLTNESNAAFFLIKAVKNYEFTPDGQKIN
jgi:hypothetical protein